MKVCLTFVLIAASPKHDRYLSVPEFVDACVMKTAEPRTVPAISANLSETVDHSARLPPPNDVHSIRQRAVLSPTALAM